MFQGVCYFKIKLILIIFFFLIQFDDHADAAAETRLKKGSLQNLIYTCKYIPVIVWVQK